MPTRLPVPYKGRGTAVNDGMDDGLDSNLDLPPREAHWHYATVVRKGGLEPPRALQLTSSSGWRVYRSATRAWSCSVLDMTAGTDSEERCRQKE